MQANYLHLNQIKMAQETMVSFTHDLCSSLSAFKMGMTHIKTHVPILIQIYKTAKRNAWISHELPDSLLDLLEELIDLNLTEIDYTLLSLNLFSANLNHLQPSDYIERLSIKNCLNAAFSQYPYRADFEKRFSYPKLEFNDFAIYANAQKIHLVLLGIIHNIMARATSKQPNAVHISYTSGPTHQQLLIKDRGTRLQLDELNQIFEKTFFMQYKNPQASLFYCKQIMEDISGDIHCQSEEGATTFLLTFPVEKKW